MNHVANHALLLISLVVLLSIFLGAVNYKFIEMKFRYTLEVGRPRIKVMRFTSISGFLLLAMIFSCLLALKGPIVLDSNWPQPEKVDPWNWDRNCKFMISEPEGVAKPCLYLQKGASENYLLIGDSHAASLSSTIKKVSQKVNANLYVSTYAGCPYVLRNQTKHFHGGFNISENCLLQNESISQLVLREKITTVIYAQRSTSLYIPNKESKDRVKFFTMLNASLKDLSTNVERVIIIGITPEYKIKNFILNSFFGSKGAFNPVPIEDNRYWSISLRSSDIVYLDVMKLFCKSFSCQNSIDGKWLFHDGNHLSKFGADKIGEVLLQKL